MAALQLLVLGAVMAAHTSRGSPVPLHQLQSVAHGTIIKATTYLTKFGYSSSNPMQDKDSLETLSSNLANFQRFAGLNVTGELDEHTVQKMHEPRCGVQDMQGASHHVRRRKRYALQGSRWKTKSLTYKILSWPTILQNDKQGVRQAIHDSFQKWSDVSGLTFKEVPSNSEAKIEISWGSYDHGDGDTFDGNGGTLAHAFYPKYGGNAHFDDSERWKVDPNARVGIDLFTVASHEFGHSLGLSHSDDQRSLMAPFYKPPSLDRNVIKEDDVKAIQELYGPPAKAAPRRPSDENQDSILCDDSSVDAMLMIAMPSETRLYAFKGANYWRFASSGGPMKGYPRSISEMWGGLPGDLDAIMTLEQTKVIYFFKGSQYWRMTNLQHDVGYPRLISRDFPGIPDNIDAAFKWFANGKMYFFKGSQYWRFESELGWSGQPGVRDKYPQPISVGWQGIPDNIDSVLTIPYQQPFFFKGNNVYRLNNQNQVDPSYPQSTRKNWFGCHD